MTKLKLCASYLASLALRTALSPLKLLPVKRGRALFVSFRGKQYSCNPRAISEELARMTGGKVEIVWAFHEPEKFEYLTSQGIRVISDRGFKFVFTALTSRVVCTNTYYKPYIPRRKDQFYLRTWHGGGAYKRVDCPSGLMGRYIRIQQQGASLYLSSSRAFTELTLRGSFGYAGEVMEYGMPRNDALVNGKWKQEGARVRRELGFEGKKLALYAPTYRDAGEEITPPDAEKLRRALKTRFGGEWVLLFRGHHVPGKTGAFACDRDVSAYPDMQPLLAAADALITDYSSSMWDMSLAFKPVFLFCPDADKYLAERGFYTDITRLPFPFARDDGRLSKNILAFDEAVYAKNAAAHHSELGSFESGRASEYAAKRIMKECGL